MLLELLPRWPFIRGHQCPKHVYHAKTARHGQSHHGTPDHAHKSWVKTEHGVGWIHHHEADGYVVEFPDHRLLKCKHLHAYEGPK